MELVDDESMDMIESLKSRSLKQLFSDYLPAEASAIFKGNTDGWRLKIKEASVFFNVILDGQGTSWTPGSPQPGKAL